MINEEWINKVLTFEGLLAADVKDWNTRANGLHRAWTDLGRVFNEMSGWEVTELDDGFPMLKPKGADNETCSYIHVTTNQNNVPRFVASIVTEIDDEWGEPYYSCYETYHAPDLLPLLIAFGV